MTSVSTWTFFVLLVLQSGLYAFYHPSRPSGGTTEEDSAVLRTTRVTPTATATATATSEAAAVLAPYLESASTSTPRSVVDSTSTPAALKPEDVRLFLPLSYIQREHVRVGALTWRRLVCFRSCTTPVDGLSIRSRTR